MAMTFITRQERLDMNYRKVEAMYRKGRSINEIEHSIGLPRMDILDIVQKIFAMDVRRMNRI